MTAIFSVVGPLEVPVYSKGRSRLITSDCGREFFQSNEEVAALRGCYVFALRVGGGTTPYYVGRATKTFRQEVFTDGKLIRYVQCIAENIGTPVLYLVAADKSTGGATFHQIRELEDFLIQNALAVNPDIINKKGKSSQDWQIRGVLRGGRSSKSSVLFKKLMGIQSPKRGTQGKSEASDVGMVGAAKPLEGKPPQSRTQGSQ